MPCILLFETHWSARSFQKLWNPGVSGTLWGASLADLFHSPICWAIYLYLSLNHLRPVVTEQRRGKKNNNILNIYLIYTRGLVAGWQGNRVARCPGRKGRPGCKGVGATFSPQPHTVTWKAPSGAPLQPMIASMPSHAAISFPFDGGLIIDGVSVLLHDIESGLRGLRLLTYNWWLYSFHI